MGSVDTSLSNLSQLLSNRLCILSLYFCLLLFSNISESCSRWNRIAGSAANITLILAHFSIYHCTVIQISNSVCIPRDPLATPHSQTLHTGFQEGIMIFCSRLPSTELYNSQSEIILTKALGFISKFLQENIYILKNCAYFQKEMYIPASETSLWCSRNNVRKMLLV